MTEDDDLRARLRGETDHLQPDVAGLVRGGTTRGRARRRRRLVGTSAATALAVGLVAAGAALLGSGPGSHGAGPDAADGGAGVVSSSPAAHGTTHRPLQSATGISDRLAALLPGEADDSGATSVGAASVGVAGSSGTPGDAGTVHDLSASMGFRHGFVTIDVSDVATTNTVTAAPATGPDGAPDSPSSASASPAPLNEQARTGFGDPETECRTAASQSTTVTEPCHQVENGDYAYSSSGLDSADWIMAWPDGTSAVPPVAPGVPGASSSAGSEGQVTGSGVGECPAPCLGYSEASEPAEGTDPQPKVATVTLFTSDHWRVTAWASSPSGTQDTPVLGADDLLAMTQDGGWFLAPGETPVPDDATTGPATCDPCATPPSSVPGTAVPVTDRSPVAVEDLPGVFSSLITGSITHIHATDSSADHPATTFQWNGSDVKISIERAADLTGGGTSSGSGSSGGGSAGSTGSGGHTLGASNVTLDGWEVSITAFGLPASTSLSDTVLGDVVSSDAWFTASASTQTSSTPGSQPPATPSSATSTPASTGPVLGSLTPLTPVPATAFADVFGSLVPGDLTHATVVSDTDTSKVATFQWKGYDARVSIRPFDLPPCGPTIHDSICSTDGRGVTTGGTDNSTPGGPLSDLFEDDYSNGQKISITIDGVSNSEPIVNDEELFNAIRSGDWFAG